MAFQGNDLQAWLPENDQWYNLGEDMDNTLEESRKRFTSWADRNLKDIRQLNLIVTVPKDTVSLVNFLKINVKIIALENIP